MVCSGSDLVHGAGQCSTTSTDTRSGVLVREYQGINPLLPQQNNPLSSNHLTVSEIILLDIFSRLVTVLPSFQKAGFVCEDEFLQSFFILGIKV